MQNLEPQLFTEVLLAMGAYQGSIHVPGPPLQYHSHPRQLERDCSNAWFIDNSSSRSRSSRRSSSNNNSRCGGGSSSSSSSSSGGSSSGSSSSTLVVVVVVLVVLVVVIVVVIVVGGGVAGVGIGVGVGVSRSLYQPRSLLGMCAACESSQASSTFAGSPESSVSKLLWSLTV